MGYMYLRGQEVRAVYQQSLIIIRKSDEFEMRSDIMISLIYLHIQVDDHPPGRIEVVDMSYKTSSSELKWRAHQAVGRAARNHRK